MATNVRAQNSLDRGVDVERSLGCGAFDTGNLVERLDDEAATSIEGDLHVLHGSQVPADRGKRGDLRHVGDVRRRV